MWYVTRDEAHFDLCGDTRFLVWNDHDDFAESLVYEDREAAQAECNRLNAALDRGPFVIGRRLKTRPSSSWEVLGRGFDTRDEALAYVKANVPKKYDCSIISCNELPVIDRQMLFPTSVH